MMVKALLTFTICMLSLDSYSQGHIEHIKNQHYLKNKEQVDCNNLPGDNLSERICANLAFQKSDSLLTVVYNNLLSEMEKSMDIGKVRLIQLQAKWRDLRDIHCAIIFNSYKGCGSCHQQAIDYLNCLRELTENRTQELLKLKSQLY